MLIYAALLIGLSWAFVRLPGGFLPVDDQGFITTDVQTPSDSSYARTEAAVEKVEKYLNGRAGVENVTFLTGFSFLGQGINTAQAFISLKDWSDRPAKDSAAAIVADINRDLSSIRDAKITALQPPPIDNLGNSSGFSFRLQDRGQKGYPALTAAADRLIAEANASPVLQKVYVEGLPPAPQVNLTIDREKAGAFGVTFEDINSTISTNLGSNYINDFPNRGRMQRVIVQADRGSRMNADDILNYNVKNSRGQLVPFSAFATVEWPKGPTQIAGFNFYPAVRISGEAKPGYTSGDAIAEMERLAGKLPRGFGYEWTGQSLQEKLSGSQAPFLLGAVGAGGVPVSRRALRKLDHSARGAADGAARHLRRGGGGDLARPAQRRLFHRRPDHHHRARREGRHPDHRIRQGSARAGQAADRGDGGSLHLALPPDPDDGPRLRLRRAADGDRAKAPAAPASRRSAPASWAA